MAGITHLCCGLVRSGQRGSLLYGTETVVFDARLASALMTPEVRQALSCSTGVS